jgi:histidinol phosphatase-like enzyme (inositol monophosphatase family)
VTTADREAERLLRTRIRAAYPEHGIAGEEFGASEHAAAWSWVVDPIDGTQAFVHGIPLYTVLVALLVNDEPVIGVVHNPALGETVSAAVGSGCNYNGRPCRLRRCDSLSRAEVVTTDFVSLAADAKRLHGRIVKQASFGRTWADAYGYLLLVTGRVDVMIDPKMALWDIAPLYPIVEEAGGVITDLSRNRSPLGGSAVAAHPELHHRLFARI